MYYAYYDFVKAFKKGKFAIAPSIFRMLKILRLENNKHFENSVSYPLIEGRSPRQNRVWGRAAGQGPFFRLGKSLTGRRKINKFQKVYLTGSIFCHTWHFLGKTLKIFQIVYLTESIFRLIGSKFRLSGYEFCQKLLSERVHFSNSRGTSPSVFKVSAPPWSI